MTRPIKTILVSLNNIQCFDNNMAMAKQIAQAYNSHIIGLYVIPSIIVYAAPYGYSGPTNFSQLNRYYRSKAGGVEQAFLDFVKSEDISGEWRQVSSAGHFISDSVVEYGAEADLIIIGDDDSDDSEAHFDARIVQATGRPVLIVPDRKREDFSFDRAIIGWDGSREATRAVFDAVPLLQISKMTEITCFNAHKEREIFGDTPGTELAKSLARYDVSANVTHEKTRKSISKALMAKAEDCDLLVIGAYGHARLLEDIFGGVTKKALTHLPCPVLMSN